MPDTTEGQPTSRMASRVGPFYDREGVRSYLRVTDLDLSERRICRTILACPTADGQVVYPAWQFQPDGTPLTGLPDVLETLSKGTGDEWAWALWLTGTVPYQLEGKSAAQWLAEGRDPAAVISFAKRDALSWAE